MKDSTEEKLERDIKREFQLERMVLFSDAVFAIVITLMAIEIKLPESSNKLDADEFIYHLKSVIPTIIAYAVGFFFVGLTWYRHLQIFGKLKDYNKGLVVCNLAMLFFIGLFPFAASVLISTRPNNILQPYLVYVVIAFLSAASQNVLQYYIFKNQKKLMASPPGFTELKKFKIGVIVLVLLAVATTAVVIVFNLIPDKGEKPLAMIILFIVPLGKKFMEKRMHVD